MRVLLFHPWLKSYGGGERLVYEYFRRSKHDIDVYSWYLDPARTWFQPDDVRTILSGDSPVFRTYLLRGVASLALSAAGLPDTADYDLVLLSSSGLGELTLLARRPRTPVVIYSHTILRAAYGPDVQWNLTYRFRGVKRLVYRTGVIVYNALERLAWQRINFAVFNSGLSRSRALDKGLISPERAAIVFPGVELDGFASRDAENYFLYVSRFSPLKRQHVLIRAFARFAREYPGYRLYLVGSAENARYLEQLRRLIRTLGVESSVSLLTNVDDADLRNLYARALAFVNVPFMEEFGIVPFEAAASGRFIINVKPSGNYELLRNFPGILWIDEPLYDSVLEDRIYSALKRFVSSEDEFVELGRGNRKALKRLDLSWSRFAKELDSILDSVANVGEQPPQ